MPNRKALEELLDELGENAMAAAETALHKTCANYLEDAQSSARECILILEASIKLRDYLRELEVLSEVAQSLRACLEFTDLTEERLVALEIPNPTEKAD